MSGKQRFKRGNWDHVKATVAAERDHARRAGIASLVLSVDTPLWEQRRDALLLSPFLTCEVMRARLELLEFQPTRACASWVKRLIRRYEAFVSMRARGIEPPPPTAEKLAESRRRSQLRVHRARETKAARPDWMRDPSLLPKKPPQAPRGDE